MIKIHQDQYKIILKAAFNWWGSLKQDKLSGTETIFYFVSNNRCIFNIFISYVNKNAYTHAW